MIRARSIPMLAAAAPLALALALSACNRAPAPAAHQANVDAATLPPLPASLPLSAAPVSGPIAVAPALAELPRARPLDYGFVPDGRDYAWIDRADMLFDTIGDAPPDYGFDYDGTEPWAWETADGYAILSEPVFDGYRTYYYEPGAADPFLVRDADYSYGYGEGRLVAVYRGGRLLGRAEAIRRAEAAARYFDRARVLRNADRAVDRRPVAALRWARQRPAFDTARAAWTNAREREPAWRDWRARQPDGPGRQRLQAEQQVRAVAAQRFAAWQGGGFRGPVPRLASAEAARRAIAASPIRARPLVASAPSPRAEAARVRVDSGLRADRAARFAPATTRVQAEARRPVGPAVPGQARALARQERSQIRALPVQSRAAAPAGESAARFRAERAQSGPGVQRAARIERAAPAGRAQANRAIQTDRAVRNARQAEARQPVQAARAARAESPRARPPEAGARLRDQTRAVEAQARQQARGADIRMQQQARGAEVQARQQARAAQVQVHAQARAAEVQVRQQARAAPPRAEMRAPPPPPAARAQPAPRAAAPAQPARGGGHKDEHGHGG
jgi:hypothetical protein